MSRAVRALERRRDEVLRRCRAERELAAATVRDIGATVAPYDQALGVVGRWLAHPALLGAAVVIALLVIRRPVLRNVGGIVGLASLLLKLRSLALVAAEATAPAPATPPR